MKQYVIDELTSEDYGKIKAYLDKNFGKPFLDGLYWHPIDEKRLSHVQRSHKACQPFYFALNLEPDRLSCEFLIRTKNRVKCDCMRYADEKQRSWMMETMDMLFDKLEINT